MKYVGIVRYSNLFGFTHIFFTSLRGTKKSVDFIIDDF